MEGTERRDKLVAILKNRKDDPISGSDLAKQLGEHEVVLDLSK